ncbi:cysteine-rich protein 2-binding protein [Lucilia sericata]|uniref:cysteine-rich protein 2-binding protein n=1 Tax=Lucilia sericata TaxID=13632 RepID=UPI0018A7FCBF|nr:cysteine-rich protein 2-binding protein [Lucilia sericata]
MATLQCSYCSLDINDERFLHCGNCGGDVHIKCLRHASTPGDLLGDVFFDFTCAKCMQLQFDAPSTSKGLYGGNSADVDNVVREKFVRQRMPWLLVITMALYNLSIKSKGLSRHGYFHWRTHIVNFIDKNWDYLFDPTIKRRKKWTGSISGALSHNSPKYFTSGQELFDETGWWKLTHANKTPKDIFNLYEQECLKRQQMRQDKRQQDDNYGSDTSANEHDTKRIKRHDSDDDLVPTDSCSRTIPYMGRKPKIAKPLNILDDELLNKQHNTNALAPPPLDDPVMPLNTVQSSLMDFLAESLASDDLNMFNTLPNIAPEPLVDSAGKNDILPLLEAHNDNANFFDNSSMIKAEPMDLNGHLYSDYNTQVLLNEKLKSFFTNSTFPLDQQHQQQQFNNNFLSNPVAGIGKNFQDNMEPVQTENSIHTNSEFSNELDEDNTTTSITTQSLILKEEKTEEQPESGEEDEESDSEEYQPRIVQVTNFQQLTAENQSCSSLGAASPNKSSGKLIKQELTSDNEFRDSVRSNMADEMNEDSSDDDDNLSTTLSACKPSLFTKQPKRQWPWLIDNRLEDMMEEEIEDKTVSSNNMDLTLMSEYEEKELLQKLRKIFNLEEKCKIHIPPFIRRFYRKLCIREWKREHGKPIFNLDDYVSNNKQRLRSHKSEKNKIIERYQLISLSSSDAKKSFYARIAGSSQYELFESPYTQRILHPFIYRDRKCCPPFLKLMCELQYKVNRVPPTRAPIDFCYVRPNHIAAVNALLQTVFWPGIDMSECLSYPDFSVVALYKKLVIGCGFLVPDVGFNEAYISFMAVRPGWQRSGIATFMLYHLIQTCMTKDITLHVSATNPAVVLYQKFGFKIEEVILNFYEKYLPFDSKHSRNAFFLRLMR